MAAWFRRDKAGILTPREAQNETPDGYWKKCPKCNEILNQREFEENLRCCPKCQHHFSYPATGYFDLIYDDGEYTLHDTEMRSRDVLDFVDRKAYTKRLGAAQAKTGLADAVQTATGLVGGHPLSTAAMDFSFIGGSMGSVVGEKITRAIRRAHDEKMGLLIISQSGGARMMEAALSLMQMAKTSANLARLHEAGLPYFSYMVHPTTGGVTASYAMLGDVNFAEPEALIGFAGPRVIRETIGSDLPEGFQRAEFLVEKGFVDKIVPRKDLRDTLAHFLGMLAAEA